MPAAEQAREFLLQAGVHLLEGLLEARAGLFVDLAHRLLERAQRIRQVGVLAVQVFLALGLLLELIDRGEIHLAQPRHVGTHGAELVLPARRVRIRRQRRDDLREFMLGGHELLGERLAANPALLGRQARLFDGVA